MRIEIIREKGDGLQDIMNAACACRRAFTCLVVITMDGFPRPAVNPAEIPFTKEHLRNQKVTLRHAKPGLSRELRRLAMQLVAFYVLMGAGWWIYAHYMKDGIHYLIGRIG